MAQSVLPMCAPARDELAHADLLDCLTDDLITPLTCILGWAEVALEQPEASQHALQVIQAQARRQRDSIRQLLDWLRDTPGLFANDAAPPVPKETR